jgi:hypothetical protein
VQHPAFPWRDNCYTEPRSTCFNVGLSSGSPDSHKSEADASSTSALPYVALARGRPARREALAGTGGTATRAQGEAGGCRTATLAALLSPNQGSDAGLARLDVLLRTSGSRTRGSGCLLPRGFPP